MNLTPIFSSDEFAPKESADVWKEEFARNMLGLEFNHTDRQAFQGRLSTLWLGGGVGIASFELTAGDYVRTRACLDDGNESFGFVISATGDNRMSSGDSCVVLDRFEATLVDHTRQGTSILPPKAEGLHRFTALHLPRKALLSKVPRAEKLAAGFVANSETLNLLMAYLHILDHQPLNTPGLAELAGQHLLDLVSLMLGSNQKAERESDRTALRAARLAALRRYIETQGYEHDLSARTAAVALKVSERYVHELMKAQGVSFSDAVNRHRLEQAVIMLQNPAHNHRPILDIALAVGFNDISYFNRLFRRYFVETPSDCRARQKTG